MEALRDWPSFLADWEREAKLLISLVPTEVLDPDDRDARFPTTLSRPPADSTEIATAENRLGAALPEDLRSFYGASNGWHQVGFDEYDLVISPVHLLKWLRESDSAIYDAAIEYADPDAAESDERTLFAISDAHKILVMNTPCGSGMYLVNFARMTGAQAFESYVIRYHSAPKRFPSFAALMEAERERCLNGLRSLLD